MNFEITVIYLFLFQPLNGDHRSVEFILGIWPNCPVNMMYVAINSALHIVYVHLMFLSLIFKHSEHLFICLHAARWKQCFLCYRRPLLNSSFFLCPCIPEHMNMAYTKMPVLLTFFPSGKLQTIRLNEDVKRHLSHHFKMPIHLRRHNSIIQLTAHWNSKVAQIPFFFSEFVKSHIAVHRDYHSSVRATRNCLRTKTKQTQKLNILENIILHAGQTHRLRGLQGKPAYAGDNRPKNFIF